MSLNSPAMLFLIMSGHPGFSYYANYLDFLSFPQTPSAAEKIHRYSELLSHFQPDTHIKFIPKKKV